MMSIKQEIIKYHFWVFGMTRPGIKARFPGVLTNTLPNKLKEYLNEPETTYPGFTERIFRIILTEAPFSETLVGSLWLF